jgi:hypothetical protein
LIHRKFFDGSRKPLIDDNGIPNRELDKELTLVWNIDLFRHYYFDNSIISFTDRFEDSGKTDQFRLIGWNFQVGAKLTGWFWIEYHHYSRHHLDQKAPGKFPVEDALGVRIYFYDRDYKKGVFGW